MRIMGFESWLMWIGWFLHTFIINALSITIIIILLKVPTWGSSHPVIEYCDFSVLLVFFILYCAASICFFFSISTMFKSRK